PVCAQCGPSPQSAGGVPSPRDSLHQCAGSGRHGESDGQGDVYSHWGHGGVRIRVNLRACQSRHGGGKGTGKTSGASSNPTPRGGAHGKLGPNDKDEYSSDHGCPPSQSQPVGRGAYRAAYSEAVKSSIVVTGFDTYPEHTPCSATGRLRSSRPCRTRESFAPRSSQVMRTRPKNGPR